MLNGPAGVRWCGISTVQILACADNVCFISCAVCTVQAELLYSVAVREGDMSSGVQLLALFDEATKADPTNAAHYVSKAAYQLQVKIVALCKCLSLIRLGLLSVCFLFSFWRAEAASRCFCQELVVDALFPSLAGCRG